MNQHSDLIQRLFGKPTLSEVTEEQLSGIIEQYPYFAHAHWLLAIKQWSPRQDNNTLLHAGAYTYHPLRLKQYLPTSRADKTEDTNKTPTFIQPLFTEDYFAYTGTRLPEHIDNDKRPTIEQLHSFTDWLRTMKRPKGVTDPDLRQDEASLAAHHESEDAGIKKSAEASLRTEDEVSTETMAEVRVSMGQINKAIAIYEKLSLSNPEKSAYFAQKIEALKNK